MALSKIKTTDPMKRTVDALDWQRIGADLDDQGFATTGALLGSEACHALSSLYDDDDAVFRSHVVMRRHGFGEGEYKYFAYPLPHSIEQLRQAIYPRLAPIANEWMAAMGMAHRYPKTLDPFLARCHEAGQRRPTPLLLKYQTGDYNCLHQDLYGEQFFPIQLAILLSQPGTALEGGEFLLTEQRPRMQSRAEVVSLAQGEGVLFAVNNRPRKGTRGTYRVKMRHGVSRVQRGHRYTTGIIFHDAA
ncbi:MAG: 2OG-Fe(II) oxygenase [Geminicoccaceae bacterium]